MLTYRGVWRDDRPDLLAAGRRVFADWMASEGGDVAVPVSGVARSGGVEVRTSNARDGDLGGLRIRLRVERPSGVCTTVAHWWVNGAHGGVWVDVDWAPAAGGDGDDPVEGGPAPQSLAAALLEGRVRPPGSPPVGPSPTVVRPDSAGGLVEDLFAVERQVPIVVYSVDRIAGRQEYSHRVRAAAARLAGVADVRMLTDPGQVTFNELVEEYGLDVFAGAVRLYLPRIARDDPQPWTHRYIRAVALADDHADAAETVFSRLLPGMRARRPPEIWRAQIEPLLDHDRDDWQNIAEETDRELQAAGREITDLRERLAEWEVTGDLLVEEAASSERDAEQARRLVGHLRSELRHLGTAPEHIEATAPPPADPETPSEAVALAAAMPHIVVPPEAPRDLARLDAARDCALWGKRIYRHLAALDAYAAARAGGFGASFWQWCEKSGDPYALSRKHLSMTESETVRSNPRTAAARLLPVDRRVHPDGRTYMWAHLKPVLGGSMIVPRIYFLDDTAGTTGLVHVGFIGPHDLMPNTRSN